MRRLGHARPRPSWLLAASLVAAGSAVAAQDAPPMGSHAPTEGAMPSMAMPADTATPARATSATPPAATMAGMDHASMPGMHDGMHEGPSQHAPTAAQAAMGNDQARQSGDPDTLDTHGEPTDGDDMGMNDDAPVGMLLIDQLETYRESGRSGQRWNVEGHYGNDEDKLWLRGEGERSSGRTGASIETFWDHAVAPFWNTQVGVRADVGTGPDRQWAAFGIQGLAPFWFAIEATSYVGSSGRTAARLRVQYELLLTQRLILQPELEANAYGQSDPARRSGSGLADGALGLRLRYEWRRQVAPYVGIVWTQRFGRTADLAREDGARARDRQWVAGIRLWF